MWPDLAKSCHYQNLKTLWAFFWMSYSVFGKLLCQLWHFYATVQIVIVVTSHILNSNIGSHLVTLLSLSLSRIGTHLHILEYSLLQHSSTISFFLSFTHTRTSGYALAAVFILDTVVPFCNTPIPKYWFRYFFIAGWTTTPKCSRRRCPIEPWNEFLISISR